MLGRPVTAPAAGALIAAAVCAGVLAAPAGAPAAAGAGCASASAQRKASAAATVARGRYQLEASGAAVHAALARVAADRALSGAVAAGHPAAANAAALREVRGHHHITAIRVLQGGRVVAATERYPFDVAGASAPLRDRRNVTVGTVEVTIQDVIGFIRLVHKFTGAAVVVRGAAGEAKSSLVTGAPAGLPASGCATIDGRSYAVRSFNETAFGGEALRVWILSPA